MSSQLPSVLEHPPTRVRGVRIERRSIVEVDVEIPAGTEAYAVKGMIVINAGTRGFLCLADAATAGLVKIIEPS